MTSEETHAQRTRSSSSPAWGRGAIPRAWGGQREPELSGYTFLYLLNCELSARAHALIIKDEGAEARQDPPPHPLLARGVRETRPRVTVLTWKNFQDVRQWCPVASVSCLLNLLYHQFLAVFKY